MTPQPYSIVAPEILGAQTGNANGAPQINRRRMLLGLAAASTAAATVTVEAATAPAENPKLLALIEELPAIAAAYLAANDTYRAMEKRWRDETPWAPDELTVRGTAWPHDDPSQPGEAECTALGCFLWRVGDDFPRRIVIKAWEADMKLWDARREKRRAKKAGSLADFLHFEEEEKRLKKLLTTARTYEAKHRKAKADAHADHELLWPAMSSAKEALELHVATIMREEDRTMEGLVIKAQALAEWDRVGTKDFDRVAFRHGQDWHGQIAASILRHAKWGAA